MVAVDKVYCMMVHGNIIVLKWILVYYYSCSIGFCHALVSESGLFCNFDVIALGYVYINFICVFVCIICLL